MKTHKLYCIHQKTGKEVTKEQEASTREQAINIVKKLNPELVVR